MEKTINGMYGEYHGQCISDKEDIPTGYIQIGGILPLYSQHFIRGNYTPLPMKVACMINKLLFHSAGKMSTSDEIKGSV